MADRTINRPRLAKMCSEFLMLVLHIRRTEEPGDAKTLRRNVLQLLSKIEYACKENKFQYEHWQHAKFALVAFLDETVSVVNWMQYELWKKNPLQMELYGRFDAGEQFFQRLNFLMKDIPANAEVIEVYYLCLTLGFKGKYALVGRDKLTHMIDRLYDELKKIYPHGVTQLSPGGYPKEQIVEVVKKEIPSWVFLVFAACIGLIFYVIMSLLISGSASSVINMATS